MRYSEVRERFRRAQTLYRQKEFDEVVRSLESLAAQMDVRDSGRAAVYGLLGQTLWELGQLHRSESCYEIAVQAAPREGIMSGGLCSVRRARGDVTGAVKEMMRFCALVGKDDMARWYGVIASELGREGAITDETYAACVGE